MKKRTILSLALVAMVFTTIAFYIQKEAFAETQRNPRVTILNTSGKYVCDYQVYLVNLTTSETILIPQELGPGQTGGVYPAVHDGAGTGGYAYNPTDNFLVHVCGPGWGVNSPIFHMPISAITVTASRHGCVAYSVE